MAVRLERVGDDVFQVWEADGKPKRKRLTGAALERARARLDAEGGAATAEPAADATPAPAVDERREGFSAAEWLAVAVGAALVIGAAVAGFLMRDKRESEAVS